jgi:hypothetical protein
MRKTIKEEDGTHKAWMEKAKGMTLEDLPAFLKELTEDYEHDYGTICHAIAAGAVAAAWAIERTQQGGITGFQAGAIAWEILRGWGGITLGECGSRFQNMDDLLLPQYEMHFNSISKDTLQRIQEKAKSNLEENRTDMVAPHVVAHWQSIANGKVPFGLKVNDD